MTRKTVTIHRVLQPGTEKQNYWCTFKCMDGEHHGVTVDPDRPLSEGVTYTVEGGENSWTDKVTGRLRTSFKVTQYAVEQPVTPLAQQHYLVKMVKKAGIGPQTASRIISQFHPENAVDVLRESPERVAELCNLPWDKMKEASRQLTQQITFGHTHMALMSLLKGWTKDQINKLVERYGLASVDYVRMNPYKFMLDRMPGATFMRCDNLWLQHKLDPDDPIRAAAALHYYAGKYSDGGTYILLTEGAHRLDIEFSGPYNLQASGELGVENGLLARPEILEDGLRMLAQGELNKSEHQLAEMAIEAMESPSGLGDIQESVLTSHQLEQLMVSSSSDIGILEGGPGTGKTVCAAAYVRHLLNRKETVAVCAPTGKAAVRVTNALREQGITSVEASTVHSLLGFRGTHFERSERSPIAFQNIVIDESSMMDVPLTSRLVWSTTDGTRLLFVGDTGQLQSVGPGAVLRDLIDVGVPTGTLTELHRNAGDIAKCCHEVRYNDTYDPSKYKKVRHYEVTKRMPGLNWLHYILMEVCVKHSPFDLVRDTQVFCPTNKIRKKVNLEVQGWLNPDGERRGGCPFRVGDKILCTENGERWSLGHNGKREKNDAYVANGEVGILTKFLDNQMVVQFSAPKRSITVPLAAYLGKAGLDDEDDTGGKEMRFVLGYCLTIHKVQGSEWPVCVVYVEPHSSGPLLCNELIYTALSRSSDTVFTIGEEAELNEACRHHTGENRRTRLAHYAREILAAKRCEPVA